MKKIAPISYMTPWGFIVALILYFAREEKKSVDRFHLRQALGLYMIGLLFVIIYNELGLSLLSADWSSLIVFIPLFVFWLVGFKWAMDDKEKALPVIGSVSQKLFSFIK